MIDKPPKCRVIIGDGRLGVICVACSMQKQVYSFKSSDLGQECHETGMIICTSMASEIVINLAHRDIDLFERPRVKIDPNMLIFVI